MKKLMIGILFISLFSCSKNDNQITIPQKDGLGRWHLIESFIGTGSGGEFKPVISNHTLEFTSDTTLISMGSLCSPFTDDGYATATYSLLDSMIHPDCDNHRIYFSHQDTILILSWESRCGFMYKYEKIGK